MGMNNNLLYCPFDIHVSDLEQWKSLPLISHFFEIIHIIEGEGTREVNKNRFPYKKGNLFLFTPLDCRGFESITPTRFCSIRFSEFFFSQCKTAYEIEKINVWLKRLEHIFYHHNRFEQLQLTNASDCQMVTELIYNMVEEYEHKQSYYEENIQHFITLILNILARNVTDKSSIVINIGDAEPLINKMLAHIRQHINAPEKLRIAYLSSKFNLSTNYVSEYFRKFTGESLQQYTIKYKLSLVEQRLIYSELTIGQIADEFGFTDESHLSKQFKKHNGISPMDYRRENQCSIYTKRVNRI